MKILILFLMVSISAFAQDAQMERNFNESLSILSDIKRDNNFRKGTINIRSGIMSINSNLSDPLKLNAKNQLPFLTIESDFELGNITRGAGVNLELTSGLNLFGGQNSSSANSTSSSILFFQVGPRYRYVLDETNIKNYFQIKLLYHTMTNSFKMNTQDATALSFPKSHSGYLIGFERSVPATPLFDFRGVFDFFLIQNSKKIESLNEFEKKGTGIQMKGEVFYNLKVNSRVGFIYSLAHYSNKFSTQSKSDTGRSSMTHTYRYIGASYSYLF